MFQTYKIATLNIKGISSTTPLQMLEDFLWRQDTDFVLLQEVTQAKLSTIRRHTAYTKEGTDRRGTAILAKEGLTLSTIKRIPSVRGISATFKGILIINICPF
jgi:exonuclease III